MSELTERLAVQSELAQCWHKFELGMEAPAPWDFNRASVMMAEAKAELDRLRAENLELMELVSEFLINYHGEGNWESVVDKIDVFVSARLRAIHPPPSPETEG